MLNLYDILTGDEYDDLVLAWARGEDVPGMPRLSPAEMATLADSWEFGARPGQFWAPGPEFITDNQCGRGAGKNHAASETTCGAACEPERWGGEAIIVGVTPFQVKRDCLSGPSGIFAAAERRARSGTGPGIRSWNWNDRVLHFEAPRGGGGGGLTVHWAAASDPKSVHGTNIGFAWCDEFGVWDHARRDAQGNNTWSALRPAIRALPDPKIIITQTPSRAPEVRALQRDAERPQCPACRAADVAKGKHRWRGREGEEPWRLPRSEQVRLHPLLNTRTTVPVRECPTCGTEVIARVRAVYGDTTDNPAIAASARAEALLELATGTKSSRMRFAPRGEVDSGDAGQLVQEEHVRKHRIDLPPVPAAGPFPDRWSLALARLGADDVVVQVDPAVTATGSADETGVVVACSRTLSGAPGDGGDEHAGQAQVVALQDWSVHPAEVEEGAPSAVWAPRAYRLACLWGARRVVVETNNGGDEVLSAVRDLAARPPSEAQVLGWLTEMFPEVAPVRLGALSRRIAASARQVRVESVTRAADKPARLEWYGRTASLGRQAVLLADWLPDGPRHWQAALGQVCGYEPPRQDGPRQRPRKDRGDALVAAAQVLLGVRETARDGVVDPREQAWMGRAPPPR